MLEMLVRNQVEDYGRWKAVFDAETSAAREAGLEVKAIWRDRDNPNQVFFLFAVTSPEKAQQYVASPASAEAGKRAGVLNGEIYYIEREKGS